jgi:hypothetical protein
MTGKRLLLFALGVTIISLLLLPFAAAFVYCQSLPHQRVDDPASGRNFREIQRWLAYFEHVNRSVFQAVDSTGLQLIAASDSAYINLDKEVVESSIYSHAADDYAVAVNEAGTYQISYQIAIYAATATTGVRSSLRWYGSAWENIPGASMITGITTGGASQSAVVIWPLSEGDSLAVFVTNLSGSSAFRTRANGVGLTIIKLY